jgi:two-component system chemotaxis response regulator CheB
MAEPDQPKIRVLVVEDSSVMRRIIFGALGKYAEIEVAGYAVNGIEAIAKTRELVPDVITLDIEMPEMDGLTALREIRKEQRILPIIMFSSLTHAGTQATVMALTAGATDYVGKPTSAAGSADAAFKVLDAELIPKILGLARRRRIAKEARPAAARAAPAASGPTLTATAPAAAAFRLVPPPAVRTPVAALVIGVSTGGPMALMDIFKTLTAPLPVPVFIVQHMPPTFTSLLAARLTASTVMDFREATHDEVPVPGTVYLAPGGQHMVIAMSAMGKISIRLTMDPPENSCRPAVDVLFRSAAAAYGSGLLALVLTGMGYDGMKGCQDVQARHGQVLAQDEETSVIWGMPGAVVQNNLANMVLPLENIANELVFRTRRTAGSRPGND